MDRLSIWAPRMLSILRIMAALLFMEHGLTKLFHFPAAQQGAPDPLPALLMVAAWLEVVGGALLVLGLFTRPVAFLLAGEMAVGYFLAHTPKSFGRPSIRAMPPSCSASSSCISLVQVVACGAPM